MDKSTLRFLYVIPYQPVLPTIRKGIDGYTWDRHLPVLFLHEVYRLETPVKVGSSIVPTITFIVDLHNSVA